VLRQQNNSLLYGSGTWTLYNPPAMPLPRPPKNYELDPITVIPVNLLCIPSVGGKVRQTGCTLNGLGTPADPASYQMAGQWQAVLPGINTPRMAAFNVYSTFVVKDLVIADKTYVLTVVKKDQ